MISIVMNGLKFDGETVKTTDIGEGVFLSPDEMSSEAPAMLNFPIPAKQSDMKELTPPGLIAVQGGTGSGKSWLLRRGIEPALKSLGYKGRFVHFAEETTWPETAIHSEGGLLTEVHDFLYSDDDYLIIDSLRKIVYTGTGATGKGGVNMSMYAELTGWDYLAHMKGKMIIVAINPMVTDNEVYKSITDSLIASVKGVIALPNEPGSRNVKTAFRGGDKIRTIQTQTIRDLTDVNTTIELEEGAKPDLVGPELQINVEYQSPVDQAVLISKFIKTQD